MRHPASRNFHSASLMVVMAVPADASVGPVDVAGRFLAGATLPTRIARARADLEPSKGLLLGWLHLGGLGRRPRRDTRHPFAISGATIARWLKAAILLGLGAFGTAANLARLALLVPGR